MSYWYQYINSWPFLTFFIVIETDDQLLQPHLRFARHRVVEFWMVEMGVRVSFYDICPFLTVSNVFYCNRNWSLTSTTTPPLFCMTLSGWILNCWCGRLETVRISFCHISINFLTPFICNRTRLRTTTTPPHPICMTWARSTLDQVLEG